MDTNLILDYLNSKKIAYNLDEKPNPEKINRIQKAIARKQSLMNLAVTAYKQVMRIS